MQTSISYTPKSSIRFNYETLCFNFVFELSEENVAVSSILEEIIKKKILFRLITITRGCYFNDRFLDTTLKRTVQGFDSHNHGV